MDLIYLDPPFNSKTDYNMLYSTSGNGDAQYRAFTDTWSWDEAAADRCAAYKNAVARPARRVISGLHAALGDSGMMAYLSYMAERLEVMHALLKPTGSIYLHCDPHASHYLKAVMDGIFGARNFRNEIIWRIGWVSGFKSQKKGWIRNHDTILYYLKSDAAKPRFNKEYIPYVADYTRRDGKKPTGKGIPIEDTWNCSSGDVLNSIMIMSYSGEKLSYPTQKPMKLLQRIIRASSNRGELVLDPFCGCGTTVHVADNLDRRWIGIDISSFAIDIIRQWRLKDKTIAAQGIPYDFASARKMAVDNPFDFEAWAVDRVPGMHPAKKRTGDGGIDGSGTTVNRPDRHSRLVLAQVKSGKFKLAALRDFIGTVHSNDAAIGIFITLDPVGTPGARRATANEGTVSFGNNVYRRIQLWSIADYFDNRLPSLPHMNDPRKGKPMPRQTELL